jgi:multiple sugar transport system permease protein/putative aldouronate transport system permease protein
MTAEAKAMPEVHNRIRETGVDRVFTIANYTLLTIFLLIIIYPLIYVVSASFSQAADVIAGRVVLWPVNPTLMAYKRVFSWPSIWTGYGNSLFYAVVGTLVNVTMTLIAAYPLSRKDMYGKNIFIGLFLFTLFFSGGLIPTYLLVKDLGLRNTRWALILPQALSVWHLLISITFFRTSIPQELLEASQLDGCSDFQYFWRILLPLSTPLLAVLALFYAIGHWNQFFAALLYLTNKHLFPLQIILRDILVSSQLDLSVMEDIRVMAEREALRELLKYALIVVASVPVLILYPFAQKYFVKGIMLGSVKG